MTPFGSPKRRSFSMDNGVKKLIDLLSRAHDCNAECITVEYKDGEYFIDAEAGNMGIGIDRISTQDELSELLIESIYNLRKRRRKTVTAPQQKFKIKIETYEYFGNQAYRIWFTRMS
jgi:hypothetical protein